MRNLNYKTTDRILILLMCVLVFFFVVGHKDKFFMSATTGTTVTENSTQAVQMVDENWIKYANKTVDNKQRVVSETYPFNIAIGAIPGHFPIVLAGHTNSTKVTLVDLTHGPTDKIVVPVAMSSVPVVAVAMEVVSTDADDYASGTGARSVFIKGLDLNGDVISETLALDAADGTTPVATVEEYSRINCFGVVTAGSSAAAEGTISLRNVADTPIYSAIPPTFNESQQVHFTVPAGFKFIITGWSAGATGKPCLVYLQATVNACDGFELAPGIYQTLDQMSMEGAQTASSMPMPVVIPSLADIKATSQSTGAAAGTASATIWGFYEAN